MEELLVSSLDGDGVPCCAHAGGDGPVEERAVVVGDGGRGASVAPREAAWLGRRGGDGEDEGLWGWGRVWGGLERGDEGVAREEEVVVLHLGLFWYREVEDSFWGRVLAGFLYV